MVGKHYNKCVACYFVTERYSLKRRYHFLPKDRIKRNKWLTSLNRLDLIDQKLPDDFRVCQNHFTEDMLGKSKVRANAVPFLFKKDNIKIDTPSDTLSISSEIENLTCDKEIETDIRTTVKCVSPEFIAVGESITVGESFQSNSNNESMNNLIMDTDSNQNKINQIPEENIKNLEKNNTIDIYDNENKIIKTEVLILSEGWDEKCENNHIDNIRKQPYCSIKLEEYNMTSQLDNISSENMLSESITVDEIIQSNSNDESINSLIMDADSNQNRINQFPEETVKDLEKDNSIDISDDESKITETLIFSGGEKGENNQIDNITNPPYNSIKLKKYNMASQPDNNYGSNGTIELPKNTDTDLAPTEFVKIIQKDKNVEPNQNVMTIRKRNSFHNNVILQILEQNIKSSETVNNDSIEISDDENSVTEILNLPHTLVREFEKTNELNSNETEMESFEDNECTVTNECSDTITTYKEALKNLKMLENFAILKCNFRAITLLNNLEEIFEQDL